MSIDDVYLSVVNNIDGFIIRRTEVVINRTWDHSGITSKEKTEHHRYYKAKPETGTNWTTLAWNATHYNTEEEATLICLTLKD